MKVTTFTAKDANGKKYKWSFYRQTFYKSTYWMLRDPEGYVRTLAETWIDSVPQIKLILSNYDMTADIS